MVQRGPGSLGCRTISKSKIVLESFISDYQISKNDKDVQNKSQNVPKPKQTAISKSDLGYPETFFSTLP
jgi:hypothetical protein